MNSAGTEQATLSAVIKRARDVMRKDAGLNGDTDRIPQFAWLMFLKAFDDLEETREANDPNYTPALTTPYRWRDWAADPVKRPSGERMIEFVDDDLLPHLASLRGSGKAGDTRQNLGDIFAETRNRMLSGYLLAELVDQVNKINFHSADDIHTMAHFYESMLREMRDAAGDAGEFYTPRPVIRFIVGRIDPRPGEIIMDPATGTGGFLVEAWEHLLPQAKTARQRQKMKRTLRGFEKKPMPYLLGQMNLMLHGVDAAQITRGNALRYKLVDQQNNGVDVVITNPPFGGEEEAGLKEYFPSDLRTSETSWLFLQSVMARIAKSRRGRAAIIVPNGVLFAEGVGTRIKKELLSKFNLHTVVRLPNGVFSPYTLIPTNILFFDNSGPTKQTWFYEHPLPEGRKNYTKTKPLRYEEFTECESWWTGDDLSGRVETERAWLVPVADLEASNYNLDVHNPNRPDDLEHRPPSELLQELVTRHDELLSGLRALRGQVSDVTRSTTAAHRSTRRLGDVRLQLGSFVTLDTRQTRVRADKLYPNFGILNKGRGTFKKEPIVGADTKYTYLYPVSSGQLIYSKLFGWEGSVALVPDDLDGYYVSSEFPHFDIDIDVVEPDYLRHLIRSPFFQRQMAVASTGMGQRRHRVNIDRFVSISVVVPHKRVQKRVAQQIGEAEQFSSLARQIAATAEALPHSLRNGAFS
jgi:type I restriction enzyme M protein